MMDKKTALVTGGSRGIGYGIAERLAKEGYNLLILGSSPYERVEENIESLRKFGSSVLYHEGNLGSKESRDSYVDKALDNFGKIDLLVNNAGVAPRERLDILKTTEESYDFVLDINLKGTFFLTQKVANEMLEKKSKLKDYKPIIINIASVSSYTSSPNRGEYCISKAGISMITKLFADRLAEFEIPVFEIRPGIIATDMTDTVKERYDDLIGKGLTPIKRWGYPEDIAKAVWAIASGLLPFSTGEVINVDGGFHLRRL